MSSQSSIPIKIRVYGPLKEYFPTALELDMAQGMYTHHVIDKLTSRNPAATTILKSSRMAVEDEIISDHRLLKKYDEISLLPPSSGG